MHPRVVWIAFQTNGKTYVVFTFCLRNILKSIPKQITKITMGSDDPADLTPSHLEST